MLMLRTSILCSLIVFMLSTLATLTELFSLVGMTMSAVTMLVTGRLVLTTVSPTEALHYNSTRCKDVLFGF